MSVVLSS